MADHQAKEGEQEPVDTLSTDQTPVAQSDDRANEALKSEMIKHRQEAARLREELAALKGGDSSADTAKPDVVPPQTPAGDKVAERLEKLERQTQLRELADEYGLSPQQADVVSDLMRKMGLDAGEAKTLAAHRDPDMFAVEGGSAGFDASMHGSARPTSGSTPQPVDQQKTEDPQDRLKYIKQLRETGQKKRAKQYLDNLVGSIAAQQVGRPGHEKLPIPKT